MRLIDYGWLLPTKDDWEHAKKAGDWVTPMFHGTWLGAQGNSISRNWIVHGPDQHKLSIPKTVPYHQWVQLLKDWAERELVPCD